MSTELLRELLARLPPPDIFAQLSPTEQDAFFEGLRIESETDELDLEQIRAEYQRWDAARKSDPQHRDALKAACLICALLLGTYLLVRVYLPGDLGVWFGRLHLFGALLSFTWLFAILFSERVHRR